MTFVVGRCYDEAVQEWFRCCSHTLSKKYRVDESYFHIGVGSCREEMQTVFVSHNIFTGLLDLMKMLEISNFDSPIQMMYALGQYENELLYKAKNEIVPVFFSGNEISKYLRHILVCKFCYKYLYPFLKLLDICVTNTRLYHRAFFSDGDFTNCLGIAMVQYVIDADFDKLRFDVSIKKYDIAKNNNHYPFYKSVDVCNTSIIPFMNRFVFSFIYGR